MQISVRARLLGFLALGYITNAEPGQARGNSSASTPQQSARQTSHAIKSSRSPWTLEVAGVTGVGVFQDIQVPINLEAGLRGDGKAAAKENADHVGILLGGDLDLYYRWRDWRYDVALGIMQMNAASGPAETQSSAYGRYSLGAGAKYFMQPASYQASLGLHLQARRSSFTNVSSGHYIDAFLVGLDAGIGLGSRWSLEVQGNMAPMASFGFNTGRDLGGEKFKNSSTTLASLGLLGTMNVFENTWLSMGVEQERATVRIDDIGEYDDFGLSVAPLTKESRSYELVTTSLIVGFRKQF